MKRVNFYRSIFAAALLLAQFACAPTLEVNHITPPDKWINCEDSTTLSERWWETFRDTTLNRLITTALDNNRDIAAAVKRVEAARSSIKNNRATYLPSLSLGISAEAERTEWEGREKEYSIEPAISWELPLFGAIKSTNKRSRATLLATEWATQGVKLSVVCEVATTYFKLREAEASLEIAKISHKLRQEEAALIDSLKRYGLSSGVELQQALSLVYSAEVEVTLYGRERESLLLSLSTLLGEMPTETHIESGNLTTLLTDDCRYDISAPLPSELLDRRWDVQQALQECDAAAADVGLARATRYPSLSLTAAGGVASEVIKDLTSGKPWAYTITAMLTEPLFNFGGLKSAEAVARSNYAESLMSYEQAMLSAITEVEQAMLSLRGYAAECRSQRELVGANRKIRHTVGALYSSGMEDYLNVIDAERELYASQQSLVESLTSQKIAYVTLCKALGGGY